MDPEKLTALYAITASRLAEIKATQEIILKVQTQFLAHLSGDPWEPMFEDLRKQAKEAAEVYRQQVLNEFEILHQRHSKTPPESGDQSLDA